MFQKPSADFSLSHDEEEDIEESPMQHHDEVVDTVVGPSVHVEGDFASEGNILVKGMVTGDVKTSRSLTVEKGAKIVANVQAENALISGEVTGNMTVAGKLELTQSAKVVGDIGCEILVIHAGALVLGKISMKGLDISKSTKKLSTRKRFSRSKMKSAPLDADEMIEESIEE